MAAKIKIKPNSGESPKETLAFVEELKRQWVETIDAIPDPFLMLTDDYIITKANVAMADIAQVNVKNLVGKRCFEIFAGRDTPCDNCKMRDAKAGKTLPGYEIHNERNDHWYEAATRRLKNVSGHERVVQIYRDRTDAKKLQNQVAQNEKLASIGQLAGGFAHEINNPLGGILVFSQMLLREMNPDNQHYQDVVEIEGAAKRCKTIVENLLDYSRQRPLKPKFESCDAHALIANALKYAKLAHNQNDRCDIELRLGAEKHTLTTDINRLTQVFVNICANAFQAMPDDGVLTITTSNVKAGKFERLVTKISDTGVGIDSDHIDKVFEPFFTTKQPGQGTGLGLSIVHGIVQDIGGNIDVSSIKNKGTTFTLSIPLTHNKSGKE